jgi:hypothetical protein
MTLLSPGAGSIRDDEPGESPCMAWEEDVPEEFSSLLNGESPEIYRT